MTIGILFIIRLLLSHFKQRIYDQEIKKNCDFYIQVDQKQVKSNGNSIKVIQLPPWSPDLNPMELIWNIMKIKFKKIVVSKQLKTKEEISDSLIKIWSEIQQNDINKCIDYVYTNMNEILNQKGCYLI
ncbi:hypothetical protein ABPG72_011187 [Tetrahymena utriculariae]